MNLKKKHNIAFSIVQPKPKPKQNKVKGLVTPIKPIIFSLFSLSILLPLLTLAVYSARAKIAFKTVI